MATIDHSKFLAKKQQARDALSALRRRRKESAITRSRAMPVRANIGRRHPDAKLDLAAHALAKEHRRHPQTQRAAY